MEHGGNTDNSLHIIIHRTIILSRSHAPRRLPDATREICGALATRRGIAPSFPTRRTDRPPYRGTRLRTRISTTPPRFVKDLKQGLCAAENRTVLPPNASTPGSRIDHVRRPHGHALHGQRLSVGRKPVENSERPRFPVGRRMARFAIPGMGQSPKFPSQPAGIGLTPPASFSLSPHQQGVANFPGASGAD
jgi:hypothetical protein